MKVFSLALFVAGLISPVSSVNLSPKLTSTCTMTVATDCPRTNYVNTGGSNSRGMVKITPGTAVVGAATGCYTSTTPFYFGYWPPSLSATPTKIVFYFDGGGECTSTLANCPTSGGFDKVPTAPLVPGDDPLNAPMFDTWASITIPCCTGDDYVGSPNGGQNFNGYNTVKSAIDWAARSTNLGTGITRVVLMGSSSGAHGALYWVRYAKSKWPTATISFFGDSSIALTDEATSSTGTYASNGGGNWLGKFLVKVNGCNNMNTIGALGFDTVNTLAACTGQTLNKAKYIKGLVRAEPSIKFSFLNAMPDTDDCPYYVKPHMNTVTVTTLNCKAVYVNHVYQIINGQNLNNVNFLLSDYGDTSYPSVHALLYYDVSTTGSVGWFLQNHLAGTPGTTTLSVCSNAFNDAWNYASWSANCATRYPTAFGSNTAKIVW